MTDDLVKRLRYLGDHASYEPHMYHKAADAIQLLKRINLFLTVAAFLAVLAVIAALH